MKKTPKLFLKRESSEFFLMVFSGIKLLEKQARTATR
jgi:hypothetical protein